MKEAVHEGGEGEGEGEAVREGEESGFFGFFFYSKASGFYLGSARKWITKLKIGNHFPKNIKAFRSN